MVAGSKALALLVVMYSLNPVYSSDRPSLLLTIQATMVILFTITQASIKPFGQSHQKTHQSNRRTNFYNQLYNSLDMFYLLNYTGYVNVLHYTRPEFRPNTKCHGNCWCFGGSVCSDVDCHCLVPSHCGHPQDLQDA